MREVRLNGGDGSHDDVRDLPTEFFYVVPARLEVAHQRRERAFRALVFRVRVLERVAVLVYAVVGEVHGLLAEIASTGRLVLERREPSDALVVHVHRQRVHARHERVHAKVKLVSVHEERISEVLLDDDVALVLVVDVLGLADEVDTSTHGARGGLDDVSAAGVAAAVPAEGLELVGILPRRGGEIVGALGAGLLHALEVTAQGRLATDLHHPGEVVYALEGVHLRHAVLADGEVGPVEIPVLLLVANFLVPVFGRAQAHGLVLAAGQVGAELGVVHRELSGRRRRGAVARGIFRVDSRRPTAGRAGGEAPLDGTVPAVLRTEHGDADGDPRDDWVLRDDAPGGCVARRQVPTRGTTRSRRGPPIEKKNFTASPRRRRAARLGFLLGASPVPAPLFPAPSHPRRCLPARVR